MTKALFGWMRTDSMMGNDRWPFYGSLAVATHARAAGAEVEIFDRRLIPGLEDFRKKVRESDIVFLASATSDLPSVKECLSVCHEENKPVVIGGVHPTALAAHSHDTVKLSLGRKNKNVPTSKFSETYAPPVTIVDGDGMAVVGDIIRDFERGSLQPIYKASTVGSDVVKWLDKEIPDRSLLPDGGKHHLNSLLTSFGCPNACTFCFDAKTGTHRRDPNKVVEEIGRMGNAPRIGVFDDNILGADPQGAKVLAEAIIASGLKPKWFGNSDIRCIEYPDVLEKLREAGMTSIYVGFESIYADTIQIAGKMGLTKHVANHLFSKDMTITDETVLDVYAGVVDRLHEFGFTVYCGLITGWPHETPDRLEGIKKFAMEIPDMPWLSIVTPYPGTGLLTHWQRKGMKLESFETGKYDTNHFVFDHPLSKNSDFSAAIRDYYNAIGSDEVIASKMARLTGSQFDPAAVKAVQGNLRSVRDKASILKP